MIPEVPNITRIPAIMTPMEIAKILFFLSSPNIHETRLPDHAPVPGKGTETNNIRAINPRELYFFSILSTFF